MPARSVFHAREAGVTLAGPRVLSVGDAAMVMVSVAAGLTGRNARRLTGEAVNETPAGGSRSSYNPTAA
jgi:hypothetical protein